MQRTKALLLVVVLLATPVLAGCTNQGDADASTTEPTDGTATDAPTADATATPTDDGGSAFSDAEEREIRQSALDALRDVSDVRLEGVLNQTVSTAGGSQSSSATFGVTIDAEQRRLVVDQTVRTGGRTVNQTTYFVNESLYIRSPAFERQYGSQWVTQNVSAADYDRLWRNRSALRLHTNLLNVTENLSVTGTETVRGEEVYVLSLRPSDAELAELSGVNFAGGEVHRFDATLYVSTETDRVVRSDIHVNETVTIRGQELQQVVDVRRDFVAYDQGATVTLPPEADGAVPIGGNRSVATNRLTAVTDRVAS
jgi:hypothetical protein